jgi:hypothetical protein
MITEASAATVTLQTSGSPKLVVLTDDTQGAQDRKF